MALIEIEYGSLASSETMNSNFTYLQNLISGLNETIISNNASINSNIASINNSISTMQETIKADIENTDNNIMAQFSSNGMFVTTYINGSSWYREYFSDKTKTNRVWLEQGGYSNAFEGDSRYGNVSFLKAFPDTNYTVVVTGISPIMNNDHTSWVYAKYDSGFRFCNAHGGVAVNWYACGK